MDRECAWCFGSHCCDLQEGHPGPHKCLAQDEDEIDDPKSEEVCFQWEREASGEFWRPTRERWRTAPTVFKK